MARVSQEAERAVRAFYAQEEAYEGNYRVDNDGNLFHYGECIATLYNGMVLLNATPYSNTTTRLQQFVWELGVELEADVTRVSLAHVEGFAQYHPMRKQPVTLRRAHAVDLVEQYLATGVRHVEAD